MSHSSIIMGEPVLGDPIFKEGDFSLHIGLYPKPIWAGQQGYYLVNLRTGCIEGVFSSEAHGIREVRFANVELQASFDSPKDAGVQSDDAAFQEMMTRLHNKQPTN